VPGPPRRSLRFWAVLCAIFAFGLGVSLFMAFQSDAVICHQRLALLPEPADWRVWPSSGLDGFEIAATSNCSEHGQLCVLLDAELRDSNVCPRSGVSLDAWFKGALYQIRNDINVRESHGTFVVSGYSSMSYLGKPHPIEEEKFLAAFQRKWIPPHPAFEHVRFMLLAIALASGLGMLLFSSISAIRDLDRGKAFRDGSRYKRGTRNESGVIHFDDGTAPIASSDDDAKSEIGPVLVSVASTTDGNYRVAPGATAHVVIEGEADVLADEVDERARTSLRRGAFLSFAIVIVVAVGTVLWMLADVLDHIE
jgi:hypothetical protein